MRQAIALTGGGRGRTVKFRGREILHALGVGAGERLQAFTALGGDEKRKKTGVLFIGVRNFSNVRQFERFLEHRVRVRAAEAEGVETDQRTPVRLRERFRGGRDANPEPLEVDLGVGLGQENVRGDRLLFEDREGLRKTRHARTRFEVSEVRLHGPDGQGFGTGAPQNSDRCSRFRMGSRAGAPRPVPLRRTRRAKRERGGSE